MLNLKTRRPSLEMVIKLYAAKNACVKRFAHPTATTLDLRFFQRPITVKP
jgi:hypothetical protein